MLNGKYHLVLIEDKPKGLQNCPKVNIEGGDTPEELRMAQKSAFGKLHFLFLDGPAKNSKQTLVKRAQKHFGQHTKSKKNLSL